MIKRWGDHTIITDVAPIFDILEVDVLRGSLEQELGKGDVDLVFDFARCERIDSSGLGLLILMFKRCTAAERRMSLRDIKNPRIEEIFRLTRLDQVFEIETTGDKE